jgi:hypothetical protein
MTDLRIGSMGLAGAAKAERADYKTDYIRVRRPWMSLDATATACLNSRHTWTILDGCEHRVLVFSSGRQNTAQRACYANVYANLGGRV